MAAEKGSVPVLVDVMKSSSTYLRQIFSAVSDNLLDLVLHSTGHTFVQALIKLSDIELRMLIVCLLTSFSHQFIHVCKHIYGTQVIKTLVRRLSVPKVQEACASRLQAELMLICEQQRRQQHLIVSAISPYVVDLITDDKGRQILDLCMGTFEYDCLKKIYYELACNCIEISTSKQGCIDIQKYITYAQGNELELLANEITKEAFYLSQDTSGNFVIQCLLSTMNPKIITGIFQQLQGKFQMLSAQKISSNVVQRLLQVTSEQEQKMIIRELIITDQCALSILQDPYGNYVMQDAWLHSRGRPIHLDLYDLIHKHMKFLSENQYGKHVAFVVKHGRLHQSRVKNS